MSIQDLPIFKAICRQPDGLHVMTKALEAMKEIGDCTEAFEGEKIQVVEFAVAMVLGVIIAGHDQPYRAAALHVVLQMVTEVATDPDVIASNAARRAAA